MDYKEFTVLYSAQLKIGRLLNELCRIQYPDHEFIEVIQKQCEIISNSLGKGYFEDCFWLNNPLSTTEAFEVYNRQNKRK